MDSTLDYSVLTPAPEAIKLRQPNGTKRTYQMRPMDLGAWRVFKETQKPENKDNLDLTFSLFHRIIPDLDRETFDLMTVLEASLILVNATGGIQQVIEELGKEQPQAGAA